MATIVYVAQGTAVEADASATTLLDGMIEAQDDLGQIVWDVISHSVAAGHVVNSGEPAQAVAVFDLDLADGMDVIRLTNYVNNGGDFPELRAEQAR